MAFVMQEFKTNDNVTLKYIDTLAEENSPKPILLLLHGWTGSSAVFRKNIPVLSEKYRVIAPDLRGHGESDKPEFGYHVSRLAGDLRDLILHLEKLATTRIFFRAVGTSLGCAILWSYAELYTTSAFTHLIFVDQSPLQNRVYDWDDRYCNRTMNTFAQVVSLQSTLERDPEAAHLGTINTCLGYRWQRSVADDQTEETWLQDLSFFRGEAMKGNQKWFGKLMADHTALDWRDSIKAMFGSEENGIQVLVVASSRSGCFPVAGPMQVVRYVNEGGNAGTARARGVEVEWGGHWCYWEKPELFNKLLLDFLDAKYTDMAELAVDKVIWTYQ